MCTIKHAINDIWGGRGSNILAQLGEQVIQAADPKGWTWAMALEKEKFTLFQEMPFDFWIVTEQHLDCPMDPGG